MLNHVVRNDQLVGWFDYHNIYDHAVEAAKDGYRFIEIGSHQGCSTAYLARKIKTSRKKIQFYACDIWTDNWDWVWQRNMERCGVADLVQPLHMSSLEAAKLFEDESLDFIYIDADHSYDQVRDDIHAWYPKLKPGRVIAGHDYGGPLWPGVKQAVDEFFKCKARPSRSSWFYFKPE